MNNRLEFGYVELLLVSGVWLYAQNLMIVGGILCTFSIIAAIAKFGLTIQKDQEEESNRKILSEDMKTSGAEFAESIIELLAKSNKTKH